MIKRKICVITGTRAEYGLLEPLMIAIKRHTGLELLLIVSGMHLAKEFGQTIGLIKNDGLKINYKIEMNPKDDRPESMALAIGRGIIKITGALKRLKPDITVVLGDRIEALAGAIASAYLNIPLAHIHGGDKSMAGLDESARHAITKMSHLHFAATEKSLKRIVKMGENPKNVFLVGAPGLDSIVKGLLLSKRELENQYNLNLTKPFLVLLQHSVTTQAEETRRQIKETLETIRILRMNTLVIYPNSDTGGRIIIKEIEKNRYLSFIEIFKNIPHNSYLSILKYASVLIGNSSSAIIEAPSFKLPVVNIGIRQEGRQRSTNIIDVPHDKNAIIMAIKKALYDRNFKRQIASKKNPYGDGHASERIIRVLSTIKLDKSLLQKQITY